MKYEHYSSMKAHVSKAHRTGNQIYGDCNCKCPMTGCQFLTTSFATFMTHLRKHVRNNEMVTCPYKQCLHKTNVASTFRAHISKVHKEAGGSDLKEEVMQNEVDVINECTESNFQNIAVDDDGDDDGDYHVEKEGETATNDDNVLNTLALFFLQMQVKYNIPAYAVQKLVDGIAEIDALTRPLLEKRVTEILQENKAAGDVSNAGEIVETLFNELPFLKYTQKKGELSSHKRRQTFFKENFPYVEPLEVKLGNRDGQMRTYVYVPILQMLQALLSRSDILHQTVQMSEAEEDAYTGFSDGLYFRENVLFKEENALAINLYHDDWETVNPLGTSRKKHKISAFYWILGNLPPKLRSTLKVIQLAIFAKTEDVKYFGLEKILSRFLSDMKVLEEHGVFVESLGTSLRGTIAYISADNLAAHSLGGFNESFGPNVLRICRFCMATSQDVQDMHIRDCVLRNMENYSYHAQQAAADRTQCTTYGVKKDSPLHKYLTHFHVTSGLPPDIAHDLLEGIVPYEIALCLKHFITQGFFSLEYLNKKITSFEYEHHDRVNRPQVISANYADPHKLSVGGNASENRTLIRLFPLLVGDKIPYGDPVWELLLALREIVEILFAPKVQKDMVTVMEVKIGEHKELFKMLFPHHKLKPKHHFIDHYPHLTRCFGPLALCQTLRFEGKHSFFKNVVKHIMNFKNICLSLAVRHQLFQASMLASPEYFSSIELTAISEVHVTLLADPLQKLLTVSYPTLDVLIHTNKVVIDGMDYKAGLALPLGGSHGLPDFALIELVALIDEKIIFVCRLCETMYLDHLNVYELTERKEFSLLNAINVPDYYPLPVYTVNQKKLIPLKHCVYVN